MLHYLNSGKNYERQDDTSYDSKRHSLHAVELSQQSDKPCANCVDPSHLGIRNTSVPVLPNKIVLILSAKKMLSRLSCTPADGTESSSSAAVAEKTVQSSSMSLTEKLEATIKSGSVIEKSEPLDNNNMKYL